jgi:hypothetical protein
MEFVERVSCQLDITNHEHLLLGNLISCCERKWDCQNDIINHEPLHIPLVNLLLGSLNFVWGYWPLSLSHSLSLSFKSVRGKDVAFACSQKWQKNGHSKGVWEQHKFVSVIWLDFCLVIGG